MAKQWYNPLSWFGGGDQQSSTEDVLAPIRQQLLDLASGVPALTAKREAAIRGDYAGAKTEGLQNIREGLYANRGMGATSLEPQYNTQYLTGLESSLQDALSQNQMAGLREQANILGGAANVIGQPNQPSIWSNIAGGVAGLAGNLFGQNWRNDQNINRLSGLFNTKSSSGSSSDTTDTGGVTDWMDLVKLAPAAIMAMA